MEKMEFEMETVSCLWPARQLHVLALLHSGLSDVTWLCFGFRPASIGTRASIFQRIWVAFFWWLNLVRLLPYIKYYTPKGGHNLTLYWVP